MIRRRSFLEGYDGQIDIVWLAFLMVRVALALYLVSSALAAYDQRELGRAQIVLRAGLAILVMAKPVEIYGVAIALGLGVIAAHAFIGRARAAA